MKVPCRQRGRPRLLSSKMAQLKQKANTKCGSKLESIFFYREKSASAEQTHRNMTGHQSETGMLTAVCQWHFPTIQYHSCLCSCEVLHGFIMIYYYFIAMSLFIYLSEIILPPLYFLIQLKAHWLFSLGFWRVFFFFFLLLSNREHWHNSSSESRWPEDNDAERTQGKAQPWPCLLSPADSNSADDAQQSLNQQQAGSDREGQLFLGQRVVRARWVMIFPQRECDVSCHFEHHSFDIPAHLSHCKNILTTSSLSKTWATMLAGLALLLECHTQRKKGSSWKKAHTVL